MTVQHANLTEAYLHETKGVSTASANTVHKADGAGNSSWGKITSSNIDTTSIKNTNLYSVWFTIEDVSSAYDYYIPIPYSGNLVKIISALHGSISGADTHLTAKINGSTVTNGTITIAYSGSAAGDVDVANPTALNSVSAGGVIKIECDGGSSNTVPAIVCLTIEMT